jgi:RNA polymerase sigma factor (sigma-70 family)
MVRTFPVVGKLAANTADGTGPPLATSDRIDALFREHNDALVRFLRSRLRSEAEAKEAAQEAYVRLLQLDQDAQPSFLRAYLFKVATNVATDILRQRATRFRNIQAIQEAGVQDPSQERSLSARQQLALVGKALQELPPRCREAFRLSREDGRGTAEIALALGVSDRMVRLYLDRALEHVQSRLEGSQGAAK